MALDVERETFGSRADREPGDVGANE